MFLGKHRRKGGGEPAWVVVGGTFFLVWVASPTLSPRAVRPAGWDCQGGRAVFPSPLDDCRPSPPYRGYAGPPRKKGGASLGLSGHTPPPPPLAHPPPHRHHRGLEARRSLCSHRGRARPGGRTTRWHGGGALPAARNNTPAGAYILYGPRFARRIATPGGGGARPSPGAPAAAAVARRHRRVASNRRLHYHRRHQR